ncbi:WecB/TagA/CpsF family glycosyltransferase [Thermotoga sp. KOL6]|uniref:WecB/TagA/CpsF family glycosyltransferase n=1 Tax=Thermotoga sp. KOL6 TaxID=126741 RepID=UPI000C767796|nr:WecB/TagA/CpsF family glycosyltransferase [Thermotoga sp. KOL6]PLV58397.1 lipopolysaccharide biosynthesis protein [Thermotoga sp. KOL6]
MKKIEIFNTQVLSGTRQEFLKAIEERIERRLKTFVVTMNASILLKAIEDREYRRIVNSADLVVPDGSGVVWAMKFLKKESTERLPGVEIMNYLCEKSKETGWRIYLLGAKKEIVEKASWVMRKVGVNVVGYHDGFFPDEESKSVVKDINEKSVDLLFVGMGVPRQERWIYANLPQLEVKLAMGVGGSIDVISGKKRRAPMWVQRMNLEWLYRFLQSPMSKRKVPVQIAKFVFLVLKEKLKGEK